MRNLGVPATPLAASALAAFELIAPSPAPFARQQLSPEQRRTRSATTAATLGPARDISSIQDVSLLDFGDILLGDEEALDDSWRLLSDNNEAECESSLPGEQMPSDTNIKMDILERRNTAQHHGRESQPVELQNAGPSGSVEESKLASDLPETQAVGTRPPKVNRRPSLAPLRPLPPTLVPSPFDLVPTVEETESLRHPVPVLPQQPAPPAIAGLGPSKIAVPINGKRPRASLSRPAHILPKSHPSHPKPRASMVTPAIAEEQLERVSSQQRSSSPQPLLELEQQEQGETERVARTRQARCSSSVASPSFPLTLMSPNVAPILRIERDVSKAVFSTNFDDQGPNASDNFILPLNFGDEADDDVSMTGDLSVPEAELGRQTRVTSTPARPGTSRQPAKAEEEEGMPISKKRRVTVAFDLPPLVELSKSNAQTTAEESEPVKERLQTAARYKTANAAEMTKTSFKRRASRAFEQNRAMQDASARLAALQESSLPPHKLHKPFIIKKISSLGLSSSTTNTDGRALAMGPGRGIRAATRIEPVFQTPGVLHDGLRQDEIEFTTIHLTPGGADTRARSALSTLSLSSASTKAATKRPVEQSKIKGGLTLPRGFAFAYTNEAERGAEKQRRAVERQRKLDEDKTHQQRMRRHTVSTKEAVNEEADEDVAALLSSVIHTRPATKTVPFTFSTTVRATAAMQSTEDGRDTAEIRPTSTAFTDRLSSWQNRENVMGLSTKALGKQPVGGKRVIGNRGTHFASSTNDRAVRTSHTLEEMETASVPQWVSRTDQRRLEREEWSKRQREREEARRQALQSDIKLKQDRERSKLQALRARLVPAGGRTDALR
ncbi:hypothetical protein OIO90_001310 [Microbotryomycetes sp. JL221]|nr:hypothetical protein OIO90_001310 [Microbotryomycetes sp. JL221]